MNDVTTTVVEHRLTQYMRCPTGYIEGTITDLSVMKFGAGCGYSVRIHNVTARDVIITNRFGLSSLLRGKNDLSEVAQHYKGPTSKIEDVFGIYVTIDIDVSSMRDEDISNNLNILSTKMDNSVLYSSIFDELSKHYQHRSSKTNRLGMRWEPVSVMFKLPISKLDCGNKVHYFPEVDVGVSIDHSNQAHPEEPVQRLKRKSPVATAMANRTEDDVVITVDIAEPVRGSVSKRYVQILGTVYVIPIKFDTNVTEPMLRIIRTRSADSKDPLSNVVIEEFTLSEVEDNLGISSTIEGARNAGDVNSKVAIQKVKLEQEVLEMRRKSEMEKNAHEKEMNDLKLQRELEAAERKREQEEEKLRWEREANERKRELEEEKQRWEKEALMRKKEQEEDKIRREMEAEERKKEQEQLRHLREMELLRERQKLEEEKQKQETIRENGKSFTDILRVAGVLLATFGAIFKLATS